MSEELTFRLGAPEDFDAIVQFYDDVIEATTGTDNDPIWVKDEHPSEAEIHEAIVLGNFLTAWVEGEGDADGTDAGGTGDGGADGTDAGGSGVDGTDAGSIGSGRLASVAIVNNVMAGGYDKTPWQTPFLPSETAILHLFGVHPDLTGRGIGRKMVEYVEDIARERGFKVLRLDTLESNIGARVMYNRLGFIDCGYIELHYDDTDLTDFHMFEKPL